MSGPCAAAAMPPEMMMMGVKVPMTGQPVRPDASCSCCCCCCADNFPRESRHGWPPPSCVRPPARSEKSCRGAACAGAARAPRSQNNWAHSSSLSLACYITRSSLSLCVRACPVGSPTPIHILHAPPNVGSFDPKASSPPELSRPACMQLVLTHAPLRGNANSRMFETSVA